MSGVQMSVRALVFILMMLTGGMSAAQSSDSGEQLGVAREMVNVLEAYAVYKMGQYDLAFERYQALAEAGSLQGMYNLANMYAAGLGVEQSKSKAFEWYLKAAESGDRLSMAEVVKAYSEGIGTNANAEMADHWREQIHP
jgi:TPR repeat protein